MIAALRHRDFRLVFVGLAVSMVGDSALLLVPGILINDLTGSAGAAGLTILFFMLPVCAAPAFGWLIDRARRRTLLVATCLLSAVALLPLLAVDGRHDWWIVYAVSTAMGASYVCVFGAVIALLKDVLPGHLLAEANGAIQTVRQGLRLGGPLLGAAIYTAAGIGAVAVLDAVSFLVAAAVFGLLRLPKRSSVPRPRITRSEFTAGMRLIAGHAAVRRSVIALCVLFLAGGVGESAIFAVVTEGLHRPPAFVSVLATTTGIGAILGGLFAARLINRNGELAAIAAGVAVYGLATIGMSIPALPVVIAAAAGTGIGLTVPIVGRVTLLQRSAPSHLLGRANTAYDAIGGISQVVAIAAGAALVTVVDYRLLLPALGLAVLAAAVYARRGAGLTAPAPADVATPVH
jgi:MFS family permease